MSLMQNHPLLVVVWVLLVVVVACLLLVVVVRHYGSSISGALSVAAEIMHEYNDQYDHALDDSTESDDDKKKD